MFKILKNESATVEELAQAFIQIQTFKATVEKEDQAVYDALVDLQQESLSGGNVAGRIKKAKEGLSDTQTQLEACDQGMARIKARIGQLIPGEAEARIQTLESNFDTLKAEEAGAYKNFLKACAVAIAAREKIQGRAYSFSRTSEMIEDLPSLDIRAYHRMEHEDSVFLIDQVKKTRKGGVDFVPIKTRLESVSNEMNKLKDMLIDYEPEIQTDKAIAACK